MKRIRRLLHSKLYDEETGFIMNYLTLSISDPAVVKEKTIHRGNQFRRFVNALIVFSVISLLITVYGLYVKNSEQK